MAKNKGIVWTSVGRDGGMKTARYRFPGGVSRTVIMELSEGRVAVYSPGKELLPSARALIPAEAEVFLLAPAAGHTLGLARWAEHFERSTVVAADAVRPRIAKVTGLAEISPLQRLEERLPAHIQLHEVPGCRLGEVWMSVEHEARVYWMVCDSIMNIAALSDRWWLRGLQRLYGLTTGLSVGRMFRLSTRDMDAFGRWAHERLGGPKPPVLVPCHGEIYEQTDLCEALGRLLTGFG